MAQAKMDFLINTKVDKSAFLELKKEIQDLQTLTAQDLVKMGTAPDLSSAKTQLTQIQDSAKQVETILNRAFSPKLGTVSLQKLNNELKGLNLQKLANDFQQAGAAGENAFRNLATSALTTKLQVKELSPLLKEMGTTMKNTIKWGISSSAMNTFTGSLQKAYGYVKNLDTSLNNIRIVAGQSADEMDRFAVKANKAAQELGKTTLDYTNAALIYYQQGTLNDAEIAERTATTLKMANVTGEAAEDVSDYMTAVWNNFYDGSKSIEYYADVMTALGAATASSTDEIAAGLEKFAAIADTVGLSYEYATAALATVTAETRQSADVVGTAFKTLFARIQDLELGETLEDGVTLGSYSEALTKIGVDVLDASGNLREMDDILNDMGEKWNTLTEAQKVSTAQTVAGTRQYTQLVALMDNWDVFQTNLDTAAEATGTLNEQQEIYMESTRAHLNQLSAAAERLYDSLIDSKGINSLVDIFTGLVTGVTEYTEAIGGSGAVLSQLGAIAMKTFGKDISKEIAVVASNIKKMSENSKEASAQLQLMQQFKGIQINDSEYQELLKMVETLDQYKDVLTDVQYQEAQMLIQDYNSAANDINLWEERKRQAENYFKIFSGESIDLSQSAELINVDAMMNDLYEKMQDHQERIGQLVKNFNKNLNEGDASTLSVYAERAQDMINDKLVQNEELLIELQKQLNNYKKVMSSIDGDYFDINDLSEEQVDSLRNFAKVYGQAADEMIKDSKKVKNTLSDAAKGAGDQWKLQLDLIKDKWSQTTYSFNVQSIVQNFTDLTSQIMLISSSIQSIGRIPDIWNDENLSTGEKLLQTVIAVSNAANGIAQSFKLVHTTAELLTATVLSNAGAYGISRQEQEKSIKTTNAATKKQEAYNTAIKETGDKLADDSNFNKFQTETAETGQNIVALSEAMKENTERIKENALALNAQTKAYIEARGVRSKFTDDLTVDDLMKDADNAFESQAGIEGLNIGESRKDYSEAGKNFKQIFLNEENDPEFLELFKKYRNERIKQIQQALTEGSLDPSLIKGDAGINEYARQKAMGAYQKKHDKNQQLELPLDSKTTKEIAENGEKVKKSLEDMNPEKDKGTFSQLKGDFKTIWTAIKQIPPQAYIAVAAIAAIGVAVWAVHEAMVKEQKQIDNLRNAATEMQKDYEELTSIINTIKDDFDAYNSILTTLQGCTKGTKEWYDALQQVNNSALELLQKYPELAEIQGLFTRVNGVLQINQDVLNDYIAKKQEEANRTQAASLFASGHAAELQANKDKKDLRYSLQVKLESAARTSTGENSAAYVTEQQKASIEDLLNFLEDNYDELSGLTQQEYEQKLRSMGVEENLIPLMVEYQEEIDALTTSTSDANAQMNNWAQYVANNITKDSDEEVADTANILAREDLKSKSQTKYDELLAKYTGDNISKASGSNNSIYKDMLKDLAKVEGYENVKAADNGVRGTDNNRTFVVKVGDEEKTLTAEEVASLISTQQAESEMQDADYYDAEARKKLSGVTNIMGEEEASNRLISAISSGDYSQLTEDDINLIKTNKDALKNALSEEDAKALGMENGAAYSEGIETAIDQWDPFEARDALENKLNQLYEAAAEAADVTEDEVRIMVDGIKENLEGLDTDATEEELIELAKTTLIFQKNLKKLGEVLEDNKDDFAKWKDSTESAADLGVTESVGELATAVKDLLGLENISEDFLKENFDLITEAVNGSAEALDQLEIKAGKEFILNLKVEGIEDIYNQYNSVFETLANTDLEIGVAFNDEQALADLQKFFDTAKLSEADAQKVLNEFGYEGTLEEIKPPVQKKTQTVWEEQITYEPVTSDPQTFVVPDGNGYKTISTPGQTLQRAIRTVVPKTEEVEYQPDSYWVLKSANSTSTSSTPASSASYTGLSGSVRSTGVGARRAASVSSGVGKASSGSSSKPRKEDKLEDEKDRYHDINIELKQIANELEKVQEEQENLVGSDLIANLQRQYNLLNKEIDATARKIGIAKGEQDELQSKLAGYGVTFNEDGTIANYAEAWDAQLAYVNGIIDKYNGMSAEAQENYQETLDNAKEQWNTFKENVERYDTLITEDIPGLEADIRAALDQQIEIKLEAFEYEIEIRLDMSEAERDWNEFKKKIIDGIKDEDILGNAEAKLKDFNSYYKENGTGEIQATTKHVNNILDQLYQMDADQAAGVYGETYTYTNAQGEEVTIDYNNRKQALEDLKEYYTSLMGSMTDLQELEEEIHQSYLDMMDEAQEKFDEQLETYQTIDEIIQHDMNLVKLMYGDSASLAKYYAEQRENLANQLDFQKQQIAFWRNQMDTLEEGSEEWEKAKENWMAAGNEWRALAETNLQTITDEYLDAINTIFENLNNSITDGMGLDYISKEWELINQNADRYLDQVNSIYEVQSLQNKYLDAIEAATNPTQQKKLNELMEDEIALLQEKDKLSQYDLDRANLKYEIAMKQMALEESQQNKTQLRLRRDSQGNYTYQYTNDESEVSKLQQELSDLYNQLYNLDAGQYKSNLDELYSVWESFQADMYEAAQINDPDKRKEREEMLEREYGELINGIVADNEFIKQNLQQSTMSQLFDLYDQNAENYEQMTEEQQAILDNFISAETDFTNMAFDNLFNLYNVNLENFNTMTQEQIDALMNDFIPQWNSGVQQMADAIIGEGGFSAVTKSAIEEIMALAKVWDEERKAAYDEAIAMAEQLQTETKELAGDNTNLINTYDEQLKKVAEVIEQLGELKTAYEKAEAAAKKAAEEAYNYWQAASNEAANTDTTIDTSDYKSPEGDTKEINTKTSSSGSSAPSLSVGSSISVKSGTKWYADSYGGGSSGTAKNGTIKYINSSGTHPYNIDGLGWIKKTDIVGYDTGGYTGEWNSTSGKLAMLHQKELVLNAEDTKNILNAVEILRAITSNLGATMMQQMSSISANATSTIANSIGNDILEQTVHIDAQFPNVKNSNEIETAINNLVNMASQHIQKN